MIVETSPFGDTLLKLRRNTMPALASNNDCVFRVRIAADQFITGEHAKRYSCNRPSQWSMRSDTTSWIRADNARKEEEAKTAQEKREEEERKRREEERKRAEEAAAKAAEEKKKAEERAAAEKKKAEEKAAAEAKAKAEEEERKKKEEERKKKDEEARVEAARVKAEQEKAAKVEALRIKAEQDAAAEAARIKADEEEAEAARLLTSHRRRLQWRERLRTRYSRSWLHRWPRKQRRGPTSIGSSPSVYHCLGFRSRRLPSWEASSRMLRGISNLLRIAVLKCLRVGRREMILCRSRKICRSRKWNVSHLRVRA